MIANRNLKPYFHYMYTFIETHGDDIWEIVCDNFPLDRPFRTRDAAPYVAEHYGITTQRAKIYLNVVLRNVLTQPDHKPIIRKGYFWTLTSHGVQP